MRTIKNLVEEKYHKLFSREDQGTRNQESRGAVGPDISSLLKQTSITQNSLPLVLNNDSDSSSIVSSSTQQSEEPPNTNKAVDFMNTIPEVKYEELTGATGNWDKKNILGRGGFGIVFRGIWKNTQVAIKRIEPRDKSSTADYKTELKQSLNELKFLNACRHDNILPLYGYSLSGEKPCLVYQLMLGGTLEQRLYSDASLSWQHKLMIAQGTARGLQFLHTFKDKPLIHGDIKPANILLDVCLMPKIGDFGLARESPSQDPVEISKVYGTRPYLPNEFIQTRCLSTKIDTYSFGIVLYELATKKRVFDRNRSPQHLIDLMNQYFQLEINFLKVIDTTFLTNQTTVCEAGAHIFPILTCLGQECTQKNPEKRPEMVNVLKRLEGF